MGAMSHFPTVLLLAAGENTRFFPFNTDKHKATRELFGQPLIIRTLRNLQDHQVSEVVIVVSHKDFGGKGLSASLQGADLHLNIRFVLQPEAKGMGDAVLCAQEFLHDRFFVLNPYYVNAGEVLQKLVHESTANVLVSTHTDRPWEYGVFKLDGNRVVGIVEKPEKGTEPSNLKVEVLHLLGQEFLGILREVEPDQYNYEHALDRLLQNTDVNVFNVDTPFPTLKYPWHLFDFQSIVFDRMRSETAPDAHVAPTAVIDDKHGPVVIESGAVIGHAAKIVGPCYIGRHVLVGDFSFVRASNLEEDVVIGANTEVVRSIFFAGSDMHYGYIADSIVGSNVKIGAGLITANKRHDRGNVIAHVKGKKVDSGRNNVGVMIGDRAKIGVRTTTMPGVMIGAEAVVYPSLTLYKNVGASEEVKA